MPDSREDIILVPVHNRRETTLAALRYLASEGVMAWATVLVIDDGSTDGTETAIAAEFAEVAMLRGNGNWWWGGAIRRGMQWALEHKPTRIWWLNDDTRPPVGACEALRTLVLRSSAIGWIEARAPQGWSYGGYRKTPSGMRRCTLEEEQRGQIDTFSGNCVCLPISWIEKVGLPDDDAFPHGLADFDYGLRLRRAGAKLQPLPGVTALNHDPAIAASESWLSSSRRMSEIWEDFHSPRSFLYFPAWRRFCLRHWGPIWGLVVFSLPYVRWAGIAAFRRVAPQTAAKWKTRHPN